MKGIISRIFVLIIVLCTASFCLAEDAGDFYSVNEITSSATNELDYECPIDTNDDSAYSEQFETETGSDSVAVETSNNDESSKTDIDAVDEYEQAGKQINTEKTMYNDDDSGEMVFSAKVSIEINPAASITENMVITLKAHISDPSMEYVLRWEQHDPTTDRPGIAPKWEVIGEERSLKLVAEMYLNTLELRLVVLGEDGTEIIVAVPKFDIKPKIKDEELQDMQAKEQTSDINDEISTETYEENDDLIEIDVNEEQEICLPEVTVYEPQATSEEEVTDALITESDGETPDEQIIPLESESIDEPEGDSFVEETVDDPAEEQLDEQPEEDITDEDPSTPADAVSENAYPELISDEESEEQDAEAEEIEEEPIRSVHIHSSAGACISNGEIITLTAELEGFDSADEFTVVWEVNKGYGWEEAGTGSAYEYTASMESLMWDIRVKVQFAIETEPDTEPQ
jgi:hypothetical protein